MMLLRLMHNLSRGVLIYGLLSTPEAASNCYDLYDTITWLILVQYRYMFTQISLIRY